MKQYKKVLVLIACVLCTVLLVGIERGIVGSLSTQHLATRWSEETEFAQLAGYFSKDTGFYPNQVQAVRQSLMTGLSEAALEHTNENGGRNWLDAYSSKGECYISSNRTGTKVRTFGVGGDFFLFHPLTLLDGNYFDATDVNEDGVILDELVAWQLFGSNHVAGMEIEINGNVYPVRGVVRSDSGMFSEAVEEEIPTIYVSYEVLETIYGKEVAIECYEVLIANPVKGFGVETAKKALGMDETSYELIEVSSRFDLLHRIQILKNFGIRSMNTKNIVFPYWENRAKGYEDVSALFLVLEMVAIAYPFGWFIRKVYGLWKKRKVFKMKLKAVCVNVWDKVVYFLRNVVKKHMDAKKVKE